MFLLAGLLCLLLFCCLTYFGSVLIRGSNSELPLKNTHKAPYPAAVRLSGTV